jgi:hypothetical protein
MYLTAVCVFLLVGGLLSERIDASRYWLPEQGKRRCNTAEQREAHKRRKAIKV